MTTEVENSRVPSSPNVEEVTLVRESDPPEDIEPKEGYNVKFEGLEGADFFLSQVFFFNFFQIICPLVPISTMDSVLPENFKRSRGEIPEL